MDISDLIKTNSIYLKSKKLLGKSFSFIENLWLIFPQTITISQPTLIIPTLTFPPVTTIGGTTTVTVASTGGTGTKLYAMDGGAYQSGLTFTGITAGAHTLYVTDANACIVEKAFTVNTTSEPTKSALKFKN